MVSLHATQVSAWFLDLSSPRLERSLIDATNLIFLLSYCVSLVVAGCRREFANARRNASWQAVLSSICCAILAFSEIGTGFWVLYSGDYQHDDWLVSFLKGIVWVFLAVSFTLQSNNFVKNLCTIWWVAFSVLTFALNLETIFRKKNLEIVDLISWPVCLLFLVCAITLQKGTNSNQDSTGGNFTEPLLPTKNEKVTNFSRAGFLSRVLFSWMNPLLKLGYSKPLDQTDIPLLDPDDGALEACQKFLTEWDNSQKKSVFSVLFKCFTSDFVLTGLYALLRTLSFAASPLLLHAFVLYSYKEEKDLYEGFTLIVYLILMKIIESLSQRHWFFRSRRLGMKMRSALMAAIFQKQLKLSSKGRRQHSAGEIVNYIAVDAYRLGEFPFWLHLGWLQPFQLALAIALLFCTVGLGTLPGLVPLVVCAVLNIPFAKMLQFYQSKFMVAQDARQRATSEVLNNMKIIKLQSWVEKFAETLSGLRDAEVNWLKETQIKKAYGSALYWMSPTFISAIIFAGTAAFHSAPLNADVVFTILATLRVMSEPMRMVPEALSILIQVKVALDRIGAFLVEEELREEDVIRVGEEDSSEVAVSVKGGDFSWNAMGDVLHLRDLNLRIKKGEKVAVCGPVGAGKSSFLCATLGEIPKISGSVEIHGSVAYVAQSSWIQSGTVRDNILFGKPMNDLLYQKAIRCCALGKDIETFDHGDLTEIGQRGLNMSGGQRQRLQLARAMYNDADIYLLDDPFSAVDAHTGAILFHGCVMSALENKTVILVTHQVEFLAKVDRILVMENGQVTQEGNYDQLLKAGTAFEQLVNAHTSSITNLNSQITSEETVAPEPVKQNSECEITTPNNLICSVQLTEEEKMETGDLGLKAYLDYFSVSRGWFLLAWIVSCQCIFVTLQCMATYWLAIAVQSGQVATVVAVGVYAGMSTLSCLFAYIRSLLAAHLGLKASREFFKGFMDSIFGAPMLFFDSTPTGRIMTRASSDMSTLDFDIPYTLTFVISGTIEVLATLIIMMAVTWEVVIIAIPAIVLILYIQRYYIASARELVRINGTTKAPVMNYAAESMLGALTIRAFGMVERFVHTYMRLIDTDASLFFHTNAALEWVLLRVEALQILIIISSAVFLILLPEGVVSAGFMGLCLSYALTLSSAQANLTRFYSNLENYIISVERIKQFMNIPPEPPAIIINNQPPPTWPAEGRIELDNLYVKYRENAPYVLKGITCTFAAGKKVGVVGRTGSGKTTLLSTLFRLVDPTSGRILIDSWDICTIGLRDLRTKLSIIPQEPALFRGTVRSNIDPLGYHSDAEIWEALDKCQLKKTISSLPLQLDSPVTDEGENWSVGQRQLFCLGRVILRRNKFLVLDEATASIDSATDAILQRVIKEEFSGCTVITIAHRVPTVTESDMVLVLSYGKLMEYDKPPNLMANKDSAFAKLVAEYWSHYKRN
ncbi:ABC transporter C family member 8 [Rhynchospora pubera]|uniref:ABC transporter C family member 8 n=1 Tax=Rhynchospora pubera TaxID=906938 RepID=A0AAV8DLS1_9POAL|nr:ABC transporter C family member 8 [Rhynchospora pubera]